MCNDMHQQLTAILLGTTKYNSVMNVTCNANIIGTQIANMYRLHFLHINERNAICCTTMSTMSSYAYILCLKWTVMCVCSYLCFRRNSIKTIPSRALSTERSICLLCEQEIIAGIHLFSQSVWNLEKSSSLSRINSISWSNCISKNIQSLLLL